VAALGLDGFQKAEEDTEAAGRDIFHFRAFEGNVLGLAIVEVFYLFLKQ